MRPSVEVLVSLIQIESTKPACSPIVNHLMCVEVTGDTACRDVYSEVRMLNIMLGDG